MAVKATTKANTKTEPVKEEVKTVEEKTSVKKETAKKPAVKKEAAAKKAEAEKAEPAKKPAAKKTAVKAETKAPAKAEKKEEVKATINFQFGGKSYTTEDLLKSCKDVWKYDLGGKEEDIRSIDLYVKPEENVTYYVINGDVTGSFFI